MASSELDVVVIGAGAAGLTAFGELQRAGMNVLCLEARGRTGGRIYTIGDAFSPVPIELGAEFVHGRPPEIWNIARSAGLTVYDCGEKAVHVKNGKVQNDKDAWELVGHVMDDMQRVARKSRDQSFASFLERSSQPEEAKRLAASYVEGFNAAHKKIVGIASLAKDARASDEIDGDSSFRLMNGYHSVTAALLDASRDPSKIRLNCVVEKIAWRAGSATVHVRSRLTGNNETFRSRCVATTIPLSVLQAEPGSSGAIHFDPEPSDILAAARALRFGQVMRVVLRFREAVWESRSELADAGFLLSEERFFPTWWTTLPVHAPMITGWSAGPHADELLGESRSSIISHALQDLARIINSSPQRLSGLLEAAHFHNWHGDPFIRGAYSYVPAGAMAARRALAEPIDDTLFFAGEATELNGHSATVHGAIASGKRVAQQILALSGSERSGSR